MIIWESAVWVNDHWLIKCIDIYLFNNKVATSTIIIHIYDKPMVEHFLLFTIGAFLTFLKFSRFLLRIHQHHRFNCDFGWKEEWAASPILTSDSSSINSIVFSCSTNCHILFIWQFRKREIGSTIKSIKKQRISHFKNALIIALTHWCNSCFIILIFRVRSFVSNKTVQCTPFHWW